MSDDRSTFELTKARLEDIVVQVRRKDVSLEQSLDMLEEAVRLVNQCNELIDQTSFKPPVPDGQGAVEATPDAAEQPAEAIEDHVVEIVPEPAPEGADPTGASEGEADSWGAVDAWDEDPAPVMDEDDDARE
jgi:exodeoxyribonuclease VII small subunit